MFKHCLFLIGIFLLNLNAYGSDRIALIIGNSKYEDIGSLKNTINDAKSINNELKAIGYKTTLVTDLNENNLRRVIRRFSADSENASVAVVYYAGHGAQINGENYLLPIDLEIPKRESDVQLSSIKVDDIINSIKSRVKIIFLDACRDNPVLIKSLVKGRGSFRSALAPSNINSVENQTAGIFIAYATDSGNIASDGDGQSNSPFALALAKYLKEPISIDDMFSKVTREVRTKTNNAQKPFKYASLEDIFCLTGKCQTLKAQEEIKTVAQKDEVSKINTTVWSIYNLGGQNLETVWAINPNSIATEGSRAWVDTKILQVKDAANKKTGQYDIIGYVYDCSTKFGGAYKSLKYDENNKLIQDQYFGAPLAITLSSDYIDENSLGYSALQLICNKEKYDRLVEEGRIIDDKWTRFYTFSQNEEIYIKKNSLKRSGELGHAVIGVVFKNPVNISKTEFYPQFKNIDKMPDFKLMASMQEFNCSNRTSKGQVDQLYDENGDIVLFSQYQDFFQKPTKIDPNTPYDQILKLLCDMKQ